MPVSDDLLMSAHPAPVSVPGGEMINAPREAADTGETRTVQKETRALAETIVVTSGKGGVGKSLFDGEGVRRDVASVGALGERPAAGGVGPIAVQGVQGDEAQGGFEAGARRRATVIIASFPGGIEFYRLSPHR